MKNNNLISFHHFISFSLIFSIAIIRWKRNKMRRTEGTENEWCSPSAIFSHLLIDNKENERYTTWKRTENYEYSPFTIFSYSIDRKWMIFNRTENDKYPYHNLTTFHHSIAISSFFIGWKRQKMKNIQLEKDRKWRIFTRIKNEE